jgi:thiol-disulfide isomerase/thioredoxin
VSPTRLAVAVVALVVVFGVAVACGQSDDDDGAPAAGPAPTAAPRRAEMVPFGECDAVTTPPPGAARPTAPATGGQPLPAVELECAAGGRVAVGAIRGPAVINLWASWCEPCRAELPAFQRLAESAGDRVHVVGIATRDDPDDSVALGDELGLTFPVLDDPQERVLHGVRRQGLPATLFVGPEGRIRQVYNGPALDDAALAALVRQHLGEAVPVD